MKPTRFTEEQIIGSCGSRKPERRRPMCAASTGQQRDVLQVEGQVWWPRRFGRQAATRARGREHQAEEAFGRGDARQRNALVTPAARREAVAQLRVAFEVSERRACSTLGADRTSVRYRSRRPDDAPIRARLRELAAIRRRFGYRRLHIFLVREGLVMNHKKLRRLYREEGFQVRRRSGRKRAVGTRAPITIPQGLTSVGAWTSPRMRYPMAGSSGYWRSSMISRANAWR
jgi:putative transposase